MEKTPSKGGFFWGEKTIPPLWGSAMGGGHLLKKQLGPFSGRYKGGYPYKERGPSLGDKNPPGVLGRRESPPGVTKSSRISHPFGGKGIPFTQNNKGLICVGRFTPLLPHHPPPTKRWDPPLFCESTGIINTPRGEAASHSLQGWSPVLGAPPPPNTGGQRGMRYN